jgi:hypothetical protein
MQYRMWFALIVGLGLSGGLSAQTEITGAPDDWRGTPIDGSASVVATNKYGEPQFISIGQSVASPFVASEITGERLADEFKHLCLDTSFDSEKLGLAVAKSTFDFKASKLTIDGHNNGKAPYLARIWHTANARVHIWEGDTTGLDGYPSITL